MRANTVRQPERLVPAAREHELELWPRSANLPERLEQERVVLVGPRTRRIEDEALPLSIGRRMEERGVDGMVDHANPRGIEAETSNGPVAHERTRDDNAIGEAGGAGRDPSAGG